MARAKHPKSIASRFPALDAVRGNAVEMVRLITLDEKVAEYFFFVEMRQKMAALADSYNRSFGLELTPEDVSSITYVACWENEWSRLLSFKGDTTPHAWIAKIASQVTYQYLVDERYIAGVGGTKTSDYRLTIKSIPDDYLRKAIVDMVYVSEQHKALELHYVQKVSEKALIEAFGSEENAKQALSNGEKTLIEQLLNTENPYAEMALSLKKAINHEVQWEPWYDRIDDDGVCDNKRELREILAALTKEEDWDENVRCFIISFIDALGWNDREKDVWCQRFFSNTPSEELAEKYNVRNSWVDNVYSRLNKKFNIAIRSWWREQTR